MTRAHLVSFAIAATLLAPGCASTPKAQRFPVVSMGAREVQTRHFEKVSAETAMKAVIDMLQDAEFAIDRTDADLGLVVGTSSQIKRTSGNERPAKWLAIAFSYGLAALLPWGTTETTEIEASVNVTPEGDGSRVRITLLRRVLDKHGRIEGAEALADDLLYRDLFELLGRSLFVAEAGRP